MPSTYSSRPLIMATSITTVSVDTPASPTTSMRDIAVALVLVPQSVKWKTVWLDLREGRLSWSTGGPNGPLLGTVPMVGSAAALLSASEVRSCKPHLCAALYSCVHDIRASAPFCMIVTTRIGLGTRQRAQSVCSWLSCRVEQTGAPSLVDATTRAPLTSFW